MKKIAILMLAGAFAFSSLPAFAQAPPPSSHNSSHTWVPWVIIGCAGGVVSAAMVKNWKRQKELNNQEAWTCGLLYWWNEGIGAYGY